MRGIVSATLQFLGNVCAGDDSFYTFWDLSNVASSRETETRAKSIERGKIRTCVRTVRVSLCVQYRLVYDENLDLRRGT